MRSKFAIILDWLMIPSAALLSWDFFQDDKPALGWVFAVIAGSTLIVKAAEFWGGDEQDDDV